MGAQGKGKTAFQDNKLYKQTELADLEWLAPDEVVHHFYGKKVAFFGLFVNEGYKKGELR